ncbi:MAG: hypothetical protein ACE5I5_02330, partial [Candidatus Heimdallarchaeota archaeon]
DQCFYVFDFAFRYILDTKLSTTTPQQFISPLSSQDPDLWLLECSYTTLKPAAAKRFFRKRCLYIDHKFRAAKHRRMSTVLLLEALNVPPWDLRNNLPKLNYVDVLFTSVDTFKGWVLEYEELNIVRQEPPASVARPERSKQRQIQLNGFLEARGNPTTDHHHSPPYPSIPVPASEECKEEEVN